MILQRYTVLAITIITGLVSLPAWSMDTAEEQLRVTKETTQALTRFVVLNPRVSHSALQTATVTYCKRTDCYQGYLLFDSAKVILNDNAAKELYNLLNDGCNQAQKPESTVPAQ
jgi:hypothetical protein